MRLTGRTVAGRRRYVPPLLFVPGLAALVVGLANPARATRVPADRATVVVALDTSLSMEATDVAPTRFETARTAAHAFVDQLPDEVRLGLVTFNGTATVAVDPTFDRAPLRESTPGVHDRVRGAGRGDRDA